VVTEVDLPLGSTRNEAGFIITPKFRGRPLPLMKTGRRSLENLDMRHSLFFCLAPVFLLPLCTGALTAEDITFAKKISSLNKQAVDRIESFSCDTQIVALNADGSLHPEQRQLISGRYWKSDTSMRFRFEKDDGTSSDRMIKDQVQTGLHESINKSKKMEVFGRRIEEGEIFHQGSMMHSLNFFGPGTEIESRCLFKLEDMKPKKQREERFFYRNVYLDDLFAENFRVFKYCRVLPSSIICVEFTVQNQVKHEIFLDPKLNYMMTKYEMTGNVGDGRGAIRETIEVTDFREVRPGIYFPLKSTKSYVRNGLLFKREILTLENLVVNRPTIAQEIHIAMPAGTKVTDAINGRVLKALGNGKYEDMGEDKHQKMAYAKGGESLQINGRVTESENHFDYWLLLIPGSIVLIAVGVVISWRRSS
jgi:hypothetical protein